MTSMDTAVSRPSRSFMGEGSARPEVRASAAETQVGQVLAQMELEEIIMKTKRWAESGRLNRGLRLSLPFFDDHAAEMKWLDIDVIPCGRIMFVPAFVVLAVHRQAQKIQGDARLSASTQAHLMSLLHTLQQAFGPVPEEYRI